VPSALGHLLAYLVHGTWNVPTILPFVGCILLRLVVIESSVGGRYPSLTLFEVARFEHIFKLPLGIPLVARKQSVVSVSQCPRKFLTD
jgi:hypothetical protein